MIKFRGIPLDCIGIVFGYLNIMSVKEWGRIKRVEKDRFFILNGYIHITNGGAVKDAYGTEVLPESVGQYIGLNDKNEKDYYIGDIGQFDNGDRFVLRMEDWLEVSVEWIGEPECEDQARDLYRISNATILGNIHDNPELLTGTVLKKIKELQDE